MSYLLFHSFFPVMRWLHIVAAMFIVGGALFYEFVVPHAIEDLPVEQQLGVLGKVRYVFRTVVFWGTIAVAISGVAEAYRLHHLNGLTAQPSGENSLYTFNAAESWYWWIAHLLLGVFALLYGMKLTFSNEMPPMSRMRVNFVILLIVVFLSTVARHVRIFQREEQLTQGQSTVTVLPKFPATEAATQPAYDATQPASR